MRYISFDSADFSVHFDGRYMVLIISSSIVTSRKRKLRELFAVATSTDGIPNLDLRDPDAPPTAPAELKFLFESDILQYVSPLFVRALMRRASRLHAV